MIKCIVSLIMLSVLILPLGADSFQPGFFNPNYSLPSLLNPDNLSVRHSMSFVSGVSSDNTGFYQSRYTNHLFYEFSSKLNLAVDLNFVNHGSIQHQGWSSVKANDDNTTNVLPNFSLQYKPSDNTSVIIQFQSYPQNFMHHNRRR